MTVLAPGSTAEPATVELLIGGMTCGACANRVERTLNKIDGVTATVNYATEKASVRFAAPVVADDLVRAVEKAGYTVSRRDDGHPHGGDVPPRALTQGDPAQGSS